MKDRPLEKRLADPDPAARGYRARPLPPDLASARASLARLDRRRLLVSVAGLFGGLAATAAAATVVLALMGGPRTPYLGTGSLSSAPTPRVTPTAAPSRASTTPRAELNAASPSPSATATRSPGAPPLAPCNSGGMTAMADRWTGAAGSRGTTVTVTNRSSTTCVVHGYPRAYLYDSRGQLVIQGGPPSAPATYRPVRLAPGQGTTFNVIWSNWCGPTLREPLSLRIRLPVDSALLPVALAPGDAIPVPPCLGNPGSASSLTTTPLGG